MRDIPVFTTEYGVASLALREIPYRKEAYIRIQFTDQPKKLLEECIGFCRACGAEKIYAENHECLGQYPVYVSVVKMRGFAKVDDCKVESLWPVTEETFPQWQEFMNSCLKDVDNAATVESADGREILEQGGAYFVHRDGELLGAGWLKGGKLLLIASAIPGMGERVMHTLMSLQPDEPLELEVASTNHRAIRLYERQGFIKTEELRRWYKVFNGDKEKYLTNQQRCCILFQVSRKTPCQGEVRHGIAGNDTAV